MFIICDRKLLLLLIFLVTSIFSCRKKEPPLYLYTYEYELNLPQLYEISTAKWSPSGDKILILTRIPDDIGFFYKSFHFFIVDTTRKSRFEEVFSYPSENYSSLKFVCWSTDSTFIFEAATSSKGDNHNIFIIYEFNTSSKETTRIYEHNYELFLRDANAQSFLFMKVAENVFYAHNSGGVLSLYEKSLIDDSKPIRLTALHPDTLLALSSVNSARYVTDNKLVIEKTIAKSLNNYRPWIRRLELLNLSNNTHQLLKEYTCSLEDLEGIGFDVSPSGEWLIYSERAIALYDFSPDTLKLLSIINAEIERSIILRNTHKKTFPYELYAFQKLDWSPNGDKILCLRMNKKTGEKKLYIIDLPKNIN